MTHLKKGSNEWISNKAQEQYVCLKFHCSSILFHIIDEIEKSANVNVSYHKLLIIQPIENFIGSPSFNILLTILKG